MLDDALAYVGFNVITQTVIAYNCSLSEEKVVMTLEQYGFGNNIKFVNNIEDIYCDKYTDEQISLTKNKWSERLKMLDYAYRQIFNRPYELTEELPIPVSGSWIVSGNSHKYKALTEYLKKHETGFNLMYIFNSKEFDEFTIDMCLRKSYIKMLENIHIVSEKLFEYGYSVEKIRKFYDKNKNFFNKICNIDIDVRIIDSVLKCVRKSEYMDIDIAVNYLIPNVLLYKSEMAFAISCDDELNDIFEDLVESKTDD